MRKLFTHNGDGRGTASEHRHREGGADGQTINEVVHGITQCDHPRHSLDAGQPPAAEPVAHHCRRMLILQSHTHTHARVPKWETWNAYMTTFSILCFIYLFFNNKLALSSMCIGHPYKAMHRQAPTWFYLAQLCILSYMCIAQRKCFFRVWGIFLK